MMCQISITICLYNCQGKFNFEFMFCCAGATLACGTGACATVVAAVLEGHAGRVSLLLCL